MSLPTPLKSIEIQARFFRGLSDPSRLSILECLRGRALTVTEIIEATRLTQSNVSNHLSCLRACGLVSAKQDGRFVYYSLSDRRVNKLLNLADELLGEVAKGVYTCSRSNGTGSNHG